MLEESIIPTHEDKYEISDASESSVILRKGAYLSFLVLGPILILSVQWKDSNWREIVAGILDSSNTLHSDTVAFFCYSLMFWRLGNVVTLEKASLFGYLYSFSYTSWRDVFRDLEERFGYRNYFKIYFEPYLGEEAEVVLKMLFAISFLRLASANAIRYKIFHSAPSRRISRKLKRNRRIILFLVAYIVFDLFLRYWIYLMSPPKGGLLSLFSRESLHELISKLIDVNTLLPIFCGALWYDFLAHLVPASVQESRLFARPAQTSCVVGIIGFALTRIFWQQGLEGRQVWVLRPLSKTEYVVIQASFFFVSMVENPFHPRKHTEPESVSRPDHSDTEEPLTEKV